MAGKKYWRSLDDLADTPEFREFMHREFPKGASEMLAGTDRRHFLRIMGASMALAGMGLSGCRRWPQEQIAPFASRPTGRTPGIARQFATSMELGGVAQGLLVTSYDGRPIKIEGNPEHPINRGATDAFAQASVLDMYDPDRSRTVMHNQSVSSWGDFITWATDHFAGHKNIGGAGLHVLSEASNSPSVVSMKRRFENIYPDASFHEYEPLNNDNEVAGTELAFGTPHRALYDFSRARVIISLDSDFLGMHPAAVKHIRDYASTRRADDHDMTMSRLYVFESGLSLTGANADQRASVRGGDISAVAAWFASRILSNDSLGQFESSEAGHELMSGELLKNLEFALADLQSHHGESIIVAGPRQPAEVHLLAHLMNQALGNAGQTVSYAPTGDAVKHLASLQDLVTALNAGEVQTLLILGGNAVFDAPADLKFADALAKAGVSVHLSDYNNETSLKCNWHLNRAHYLEAWGDGRSWDGTVTIGQPLIEPLFSSKNTLHGAGKSVIELLATVTGDSVTEGHDLVRRTFQEMTGLDDYQSVWRRSLHDGFLAGSAWSADRQQASNRNLTSASQALFARWSELDRTSWEVGFAADSSVYDGRFANNGWMQELPDPITKLTWDNAVIMSPNSADSLGVKLGDNVSISLGEFTINAAVLMVPGMPLHCVQLNLGYGRTFEGNICTGAGFGFYGIRTSRAMGYGDGAQVSKTSGSYVLATTQDHHAIDVDSVPGRGIQERIPTLVREASLDEYKHDPKFVQKRVHVTHRLSLFEEGFAFHSPDDPKSSAYAWGMSIDLTTCVGCSACVVACQAENNIPIVGKDQINRGRELHWLRIDRYYSFGKTGGSYDRDKLRNVVLQPVACHHCENAPCEQVCPVAATVHDQDGLNVMVYNRCVGTRYCSNNCPYKVRRFNYFDYHRRGPLRETGLLHVKLDYFTKAQADAGPLKQMQFNPEVTVRMRGVMEKCTYCIQRISDARIKAKNDWVKTPPDQRSARTMIEDGSFTTACAQACPARAIVFGDLKDRNSQVAKLHGGTTENPGSPRSYEMLEELNVKPRTRYLAKLRNPAESGSPESTHASEVSDH